MTELFAPDLEHIYDLPAIDSWPAARHRFDSESCWAVRAALAAERPLLLRGEPGIGKSQLARAAAEFLKVPFLYHVVDERSERDDMLYQYDAVSRLAQAQLAAVVKVGDDLSWEERMAESRFIRPGALWWAFDWAGASDQAKRYFCECPEPGKPEGWTQTPGEGHLAPCGSVVLIDEIDKADPSVPNGLLESLGNTGFQTAQLDRAVRLPKGAAPPLVVITTNEERELPAAFLRRCLVLHMRFPPEGKSVEEFLLERARVFWTVEEVGDANCRDAIRLLEEDRKEAGKHGLARPGAAELLDMLRVLARLHSGDEAAQRETLSQIRDFALKKNLPEGTG